MAATWPDLIPALTAEERAGYEYAVPNATGLADVALDTVRGPTERQSTFVAAVAEWSGEQRRLAALRMHLDTLDWERTPYTYVPDAMQVLTRHPIPWTRADLIWALQSLANDPGFEDGDPHCLPATIAAELDSDQLSGLGPALRELASAMARERFIVKTRRKLVRLYSTGADRAEPGGLPAHLLHSGDSFGPATRDELAGVLGKPGVGEAFEHAATLKSPAPSARWVRAAGALLPPAGDAVRAVLDRFTGHGHYVHGDTDVLLRGLVCMLAVDGSDASTRLIERVAVATSSSQPRRTGYPFAPQAAAAAVEALAARSGDGPVRTLALLSLRVRNKALLSRIQGALERAGAARGWQPGEAQELAVDDHGLDAGGQRTWTVGGYTAVVELGEDKPRLRFECDGTQVKGVPAAVKDSPVLAEAKALVKAVTATLAAERVRVEALMSQERTWAPADWTARYLDHPVTGVLAQRLIWQVRAEGTPSDGATWTAGIPERGDSEWRLAGRPVTGRVRLWHPIDAEPAEVVTWRDRVTAAGLRQPFKQAFREVYRLTPAEESAGVRSSRYAEHILMYRQASALLRARGWQAGYLGSWDGGYTSEATKLLGGGAWRAALHHHAVAAAGVPSHTVVLCGTGHVWFTRSDGTAASLVDVPDRVFSEAMRDVDLFVGVTSIATDETWLDRADDQLFPYWQLTSSGPLTARAEVRRDALARLLPKLSIADRCELGDRYLRVRGTRRTYRIHLGSGNILMEPEDAYLCIVPAMATAKHSAVRLPFDDDPMLTLVLSKAMLLAADDRITDPTILHQLG